MLNKHVLEHKFRINILHFNIECEKTAFIQAKMVINSKIID